MVDEKSANTQIETILKQLQEPQGDFLSTVLETLPVGMIVAEEPSGKVIVANERARKMCGCLAEPPERIGEWLTYLTFDSGGRPYGPDESPLARAARTGEGAVGEEIQFVRSDGSCGIGLISSSPVRDAEGRTVAVVVMLDDITERREKEEQSAWLATFPKVSPYPISEVDLEGHVFFLNPTGERLFPDLKARQASHPWLGDWEAVADRIRRGETGPVTREVAVEGRWYQQMMHYVEPARRVRIYGMDITERRRAEETLRESEERFRIMADGSPVMIWVSDAEGGAEFVNRRYREFFGVSYEQVKGSQWQPLIHPDDAPKYVAALLRAVREHTPFRAEARVRRADGEWRWVESYGEPRFSAGGEFLGHGGISADITDRKRAEEGLADAKRALQRERDVLQAVMNGARNSHLVYLDRDFNFVRVNATYAATCGYRPEEMIGKNHFALYPHPENEAIFARVRDTGEPFEVHDKPFEFPDQPERGVTYWDWTLTPVKDSGGRVTGLVLSLFETTERKRTEEALKASEERERGQKTHLQTVLETAPAIIWIAHDREARSISGNRAAHELLRLPEPAGMSKTGPAAEDLAHYRVFEDGVELAPEEMPIQRVAASGNSLRDYTMGIAFDDGSVCYLFGNVNPMYDSEGQPAGAVAAFVDITERKRAEEALRVSEERLKRAQEIAHVGSWELDLRTDRLTWSDEIYRIFGLKPQEFGATYEAFLETVHPDDRAAVDAAYWGSLKAGKSFYEIEHRIVTRDRGEIRWVHEKCEHIRDGSGAVVRSIGMVQDMTERKEAGEALRKAHDELEERVRERTSELELRTVQLRSLVLELTQAESRERKRLAAVLHDHLQQLLVAARLGTDLAERQAVEKELKESVRNVANLLDESIKVSRSLTVELSPPILQEAGLVPGVRWLARWMGEKHGLSVDVIADADIPADPEGVTILLFQSIRELLFNVVKHAGAAAQVTISVVDGNTLRIAVSDRGAGFDVAQVEARGSEAGFGLFSIRERISFLGGRMDIESAPGSGTRVTLLTPLSARRAPEKAVAATTAAARPAGGFAGTAEPSGGQRIRVLIADDHRIMREGLAKLIQGEKDMEVAGEASDGQEAVEMAHRLRPDVIIMDMSMPRMNGIDATERIAAELTGIRVIGLSMYEKADREEAMRRVGAIAYLTKDGPSEDLIAAIRGPQARRR